MLPLYMLLTAIHLVAIVVTGIMWATIDVVPGSKLKANFRDIRAVHFGSLYLVPWFLGLAWAFDKLQVPAWQQVLFPAGLGALVFFSSIAYMLPRQPGIDPFYYWTKGWGLVLAGIGLACLATAMFWTAGALVWYAVRS